MNLSAIMLFRVIVLMALTLQSVIAQVPFLGSCPKVTVMTEFDPAKYLGKWYEAERYFAVFQFGGKCVTATYAQPAEESDQPTITVLNRQISTLTGISSAIEGIATLAGNTTEAKLSVRFPSLPVDFDAPYWVLKTDYDKYAVVWSCTDLGFINTRNVWILTRDRHPSLDIMQKAYSILDKNSISRGYLFRTDQKNCNDHH